MIVAAAIEKMIAFYNGNLHDINHFLKVWAMAKTIGFCWKRIFWSTQEKAIIVKPPFKAHGSGFFRQAPASACWTASISVARSKRLLQRWADLSPHVFFATMQTLITDSRKARTGIFRRYGLFPHQ